MKHIVFFMSGWFIVFFGVLLPQVRAVSISIQSVPPTIDQNQDYEIPVTLECPNCSSDSYLRAVFYSAGNSNYFGFTQSGEGLWVNAPGGSCTKYFVINTGMLQEGSWSGTLKIKPDSTSTYYNGPGEYLFKVGRYTGSCGSPTWSSEKTIAIVGPTHTPTPTVTPTTAATLSPSPTATVIVHTPTVTTSPTPSTTIAVSPKPSMTRALRVLSASTVSADLIDSVDALSEESLAVPLRTGASASSSLTKPILISLVLVASGFGLLSGVFAWIKHNELSKEVQE